MTAIQLEHVPIPPQSHDSAAETRNAIAVLYETHFERVARYIAVRIGNMDEAEDMASEVFFRAIRAAERYTQGAVPMEAWIFAIARNLTVDYLRKKRRRPILEVLDDARLATTTEDPTKNIEGLEQIIAVNTAVTRLTKTQCTVLSLRFVEEMTSEEAGNVLGRSAGAMREMQRAAVAKLRGILGEKRKFPVPR